MYRFASRLPRHFITVLLVLRRVWTVQAKRQAESVRCWSAVVVWRAGVRLLADTPCWWCGRATGAVAVGARSGAWGAGVKYCGGGLWIGLCLFGRVVEAVPPSVVPPVVPCLTFCACAAADTTPRVTGLQPKVPDHVLPTYIFRGGKHGTCCVFLPVVHACAMRAAGAPQAILTPCCAVVVLVCGLVWFGLATAGRCMRPHA